ncbi:hypothetical protein J6590_102954, partial [Homalodisca vitripennis]
VKNMFNRPTEKVKDEHGGGVGCQQLCSGMRMMCVHHQRYSSAESGVAPTVPFSREWRSTNGTLQLRPRVVSHQRYFSVESGVAPTVPFSREWRSTNAEGGVASTVLFSRELCRLNGNFPVEGGVALTVLFSREWCSTNGARSWGEVNSPTLHLSKPNLAVKPVSRQWDLLADQQSYCVSAIIASEACSHIAYPTPCVVYRLATSNTGTALLALMLLVL